MAVMINPKTTIHQSTPDFTPNVGGNIKFPAPKKSENNAKPAIQISFVLFMGNLIFMVEIYIFLCDAKIINF
jgi:hypothetical protein